MGQREHTIHPSHMFMSEYNPVQIHPNSEPCISSSIDHVSQNSSVPEYADLHRNSFSSRWNSSPVSSNYCSSNIVSGISNYTSTGSTSFVPCTQHQHHPWNASLWHTAPVTASVFSTECNGNRPRKRRFECEQGNNVGCYGEGSSSSLVSSIPQTESSSGAQRLHWNFTDLHRDYGNCHFQNRSATHQRNVRSRRAITGEFHVPRNVSSQFHSTAPCPSDQTQESVVVVLNSDNNTQVQHHPPSSAHGRSSTSGSHRISGSLETTQPHDPNNIRYPRPSQSFYPSATQDGRGTRHGYSYGMVDPYRGTTSSFRHSGNMPTGDSLPSYRTSYHVQNGFRMHAHSRQRGSFPSSIASVGSVNSGSSRIGRNRDFYDRFHVISDEPIVNPELLIPESSLLIGQPSLYDSRSFFDRHRSMRLDIDNMSYEELLALGESIGNVCTGLSQDQISKCLKETIHFSSNALKNDNVEDPETCPICLDEYQAKEELGILICQHKYHGSCIKKWLMMKNSCPICKATVSKDK